MKSPYGYGFREFKIPSYMAGGIIRYINDGILPGHFLRAVIENNLFGAVSCADEQNLKNIPAYVGWFYNEAPSSCWGSAEAVTAWHGHGGLAEWQPRLELMPVDE